MFLDSLAQAHLKNFDAKKIVQQSEEIIDNFVSVLTDTLTSVSKKRLHIYSNGNVKCVTGFF